MCFNESSWDSYNCQKITFWKSVGSIWISTGLLEKCLVLFWKDFHRHIALFPHDWISLNTAHFPRVTYYQGFSTCPMEYFRIPINSQKAFKILTVLLGSCFLLWVPTKSLIPTHVSENPTWINRVLSRYDSWLYFVSIIFLSKVDSKQCCQTNAVQHLPQMWDVVNRKAVASSQYLT